MENTKATYNLDEAIKQLKASPKRKFVETVDVDVQLSLKEKQKKESIKGSVTLPHKFGADKKIIVFCEEKDVDVAKKAGASEAGLDDLKTAVMEGKVEFDIVIATPSVMPKIVMLGKVLGPRGLMPNPKNGTVTDNVEAAVKSFSGGKMNFKMIQDQGTVKAKVAKVDMNENEIKENVLTFLKGVFNESKRLKANPFKRIIVKTTMGSSVNLDVNGIIEAVS